MDDDIKRLGDALIEREGGYVNHPAEKATPAGPAQAARQDRLPDALLATERAIQLDELIKWVRAQAKVDPNAGN